MWNGIKLEMELNVQWSIKGNDPGRLPVPFFPPDHAVVEGGGRLAFSDNCQVDLMVRAECVSIATVCSSWSQGRSIFCGVTNQRAMRCFLHSGLSRHLLRHIIQILNKGTTFCSRISFPLQVQYVLQKIMDSGFKI